MNVFHDHSPKNRLLLVLRDLLEHSNHYTIKMLASKYNVHPDTISNDLDELKNSDFLVCYDSKYRYSIVSRTP